MSSSLYVQPSFPHCFGLAPDANVPDGDMGPRALPYVLNVGNNVIQTFDLTKEIDNGQISNIQAVFIDNSANTSPFVLASSEITGMQIVVKAGTQGTYPFLGKTFSRITASSSNAGSVNVGVMFLNTPVPFGQWASV